MPDWITHLVLDYFCCLSLRIDYRHWRKVLAGSLCVDIFHGLPMLGFLLNDFSLEQLLHLFHEPTHSFMGIGLLSAVLAALFCFNDDDLKQFWLTYRLVFFGALGHLLLDFIHNPFPELSYPLLTPLWREKFSLSLVSLDEFFLFQLLSIPIVLIMFVDVVLREQKDQSLLSYLRCLCFSPGHR